jgi:protein phosphatase 2C family protein 2/3
MDMDQRTRNFGSKSGRIILLGDGTEVLTDSANEDMLDNEEDDDHEVNHSSNTNNDRSDREGTPGPTSESKDDSPSSTKTDSSDSTSTQEEPKMTVPTSSAKEA